MRRRRPIAVILLGGLIAAGWPPGAARADTVDYDHPLVWAVFGTLLVDTGVTIANLLMLGSDTANPRNGWIGVGAGAVSYGLIGVAYAVGDDVDAEVPVIMGTAGTAALVTGILVLRTGGGHEDAGSRLSIAPCLVRGEGESLEPGIAVGLRF